MLYYNSFETNSLRRKIRDYASKGNIFRIFSIHFLKNQLVSFGPYQKNNKISLMSKLRLKNYLSPRTRRTQLKSSTS